MGLVARPRPLFGQSPECYLRTLTARNGYPSVARLMASVFGNNKLQPYQLTPAQIRMATGHRCTPFHGVQLLRDEQSKQPYYGYGQLSIPEHHLCAYEKHCPECIQELGMSLAKWRIGWLPLCTRHQCLLVPVDSKLIKPSVFPKLDFFEEDYFTAQSQLEARLEFEAFQGMCAGESIVDEMDKHLVQWFGFEATCQLKELKRRYPLKYFPLDDSKTLCFIHTIYMQQLHHRG